jgi:hypothetical protein
MTEVTWLCLLAGALAFIAIALGFVSVGIIGLVLSPALAWYDWRAFGSPPDEPRWWSRFGPSPPDDGGGSKVPATLRPRPNKPSDAQALPLPDEE